MSTDARTNPLERFVCDYAETRGGLWEEIEPQVYDLMLPGPPGDAGGAAPEVRRVVLDPEALAEHRGSRFIGLGSPDLDEMLDSARLGAPFSRAWIAGVPATTRDLAGHLRRRLDLQDGATLAVHGTRALECTVAVHWFRATYVSDEKEQDTFVVAIDGQSGRQVRHLERLKDWGRLQEEPVEALPEAPRIAPAEAYGLARDRVMRSISSAANTRRRELAAFHARREARMADYYTDLEREVEQQIERARRRGDDPARALARRETVRRERQRRLAELKRKCSLTVSLSLANILEVRQPKLFIDAALSRRPGRDRARALRGGPVGVPHAEAPVTLVWDPLVESVEAPACPGCGQPTFSLRASPGRTEWRCPGCDPAAGRFDRGRRRTAATARAAIG